MKPISLAAREYEGKKSFRLLGRVAPDFRGDCLLGRDQDLDRFRFFGDGSCWFGECVD